MVSFGNWIDREPRRFEYLHRLVAYLSLALILVVYHFTSEGSNYQVYVPLLLIALLLITPKICRIIEYKYNRNFKIYTLFLIDIAVVAVYLSAVHLNLVLTLLILFALLYSMIHEKIPFSIASLACLFGVTLFYLCNIFVFGFGRYFEMASVELTILAFLCMICYFGMGSLYQARRVQVAIGQQEYYYSQMHRYMEFSNQLSRYAPLQLWQSIMKGESEAKIEYKRKKITVFFSDIQGFTELSETLIPDDLAFLLNDYLSHMTEIAKQYEGTVDKFMGDAILVFFGDPNTQGVEQDAKTCVDMALAMRQQMKLLRERWMKMGYPPLHIRMGVSTGYCHVGNYGTAHRMAYTIVGHDVNLAARLQSAAEVDEILISEDTYKFVKDSYMCAPREPIDLKGIQAPVKTWQVMEKYKAEKMEYQRWFDYEYKGFNLLLNLDEVQNFEYSELITVLEKMIERIKAQQMLTNAQGIVKLRLEDEVILDVTEEPRFKKDA
ncbi:adenylate/guanylate cyclase domain-containing protein [Acinetobacter equi]|uniref:Guanylate cyclase n=1 Tax=Acinetobacter equi TaxID=1324350 RepID=A0A0N9W345_9GAMM|nr:adenylate/guanylate cyclase domain-containing protein [Acinetobacter equi]ALH96206.1 guanylate cyclase [Acinetobacter equi]